jgi:hypothetical protein
MPGLNTLMSVLSGGTLLTKVTKRRADAAIFDLDSSGSATGRVVAFQYFPETVTDTKAVNWVAREIPGGSLPIYQWVSSGERAISFTAVFTADMDMFDVEGIPKTYNDLKSDGQLARNADVTAAITWLRRFMLPTYGSPGTVGVPNTQAPRFMRLMLQGSGIGLSGGESQMTGPTLAPDVINCLMSQCDVTYVAMFPSGAPRVAEVQLTFLQTPQIAGKGVVFPMYGGPGGGMEAAIAGNGTTYFGYAVQPKGR